MPSGNGSNGSGGFKEHVSLDFNGTTARTEVLFSRVARELFGVEISPDIMSRRIVVGQMGRLTNDQYSHVHHEAFRDHQRFLDEVPPNREALEVIQALVNIEIPVLITTSSGTDAFPAISKWCDLYGLNEGVMCVGAGQDGSKVDLFRRFHVRANLEDKVRPLRDAIGIVRTRCLLTREWNRGQHVKGIAFRVNSISEFFGFCIRTFDM